MKVELVPADQAGELFERILKVRNPALAKTRARHRGIAKRKATLAGARYRERPHGSGAFLVGGQLGQINRELSAARVVEYWDAMQSGLWLSTPDPIAVADDGHVLNGQHRLAAALDVEEWPDAVPVFVVVWGVDKRAALMMDEAKRSATDRRIIGVRLVGGLA
jgi:hypothetical protein